MAEYNIPDVAAMQQDASRRVQEMQRRAQEKVSYVNLSAYQNQPSQPPEDKSFPSKEKTNNSNKEFCNYTKYTGDISGQIRSVLPPFLQNILDTDNDKILLILLIIFLQNEGADMILILALFYLML